MVFDCGPNGEIVKVFVPVPPVALDVMLPLLLPKHNGDTKLAELISNNNGSFTTTADVLVQPFTSVTVTVYV